MSKQYNNTMTKFHDILILIRGRDNMRKYINILLVILFVLILAGCERTTIEETSIPDIIEKMDNGDDGSEELEEEELNTTKATNNKNQPTTAKTNISTTKKQSVTVANPCNEIDGLRSTYQKLRNEYEVALATMYKEQDTLFARHAKERENHTNAWRADFTHEEYLAWDAQGTALHRTLSGESWHFSNDWRKTECDFHKRLDKASKALGFAWLRCHPGEIYMGRDYNTSC